MIEDIVDLPSQLNCMLLTNLDVLEERQVVVEDARHTHIVPWLISDLSESGRLGETCNIKRSGSARRIRAEITLHRITHHVHTRVIATTGKVCDWHASLCGGSRRTNA